MPFRGRDLRDECVSAVSDWIRDIDVQSSEISQEFDFALDLGSRSPAVTIDLEIRSSASLLDPVGVARSAIPIFALGTLPPPVRADDPRNECGVKNGILDTMRSGHGSETILSLSDVGESGWRVHAATDNWHGLNVCSAGHGDGRAARVEVHAVDATGFEAIGHRLSRQSGKVLYPGKPLFGHISDQTLVRHQHRAAVMTKTNPENVDLSL
jgi:hypothetical protein